MSDDQELLVFNGINGATGKYLLEMTPQQIAAVARGETIDPAHLQELKVSHERFTQGTFGVRARVDPADLAQTGWAVLFAHDADPAIREALEELLDLRRKQASQRKEQYYREF